MADLQDTLLQEFQQVQGAVTDSTEAWHVESGRGSAQKNTAPRGNVDSLGDRTGTVTVGGSSGSKSSGSSSGGILSDIEGVLAGGLGIVPLGLELASIFGGGESTPPPLTRYAMPDSIAFTGSTDGSGGLSNADFGQRGMPRSYGAPSSQYSTSTVRAPSAPAAQDTQSSPQGNQSQPIQITVQAMDAQSFLDRSDDIASAVNKALLSLHPIADTISNL
ncbi:MAG: hypothetical protein WDO73_17530 [Ignavibacteriota bacterium]